jgi:hypothetical protein
VQVYDERFILLVGNKVSFGAKELSDQSEGLTGRVADRCGTAVVRSEQGR